METGATPLSGPEDKYLEPPMMSSLMEALPLLTIFPKTITPLQKRTPSPFVMAEHCGSHDPSLPVLTSMAASWFLQTERWMWERSVIPSQQTSPPLLPLMFPMIVCSKGTQNQAHQPRIHDLRATFAVHRLVAWYREGVDVQQWLPFLATYLGHTDLSGTQTYLRMTPELLGEASRLFETYATSPKEVEHE